MAKKPTKGSDKKLDKILLTESVQSYRDSIERIRSEVTAEGLRKAEFYQEFSQHFIAQIKTASHDEIEDLIDAVEYAQADSQGNAEALRDIRRRRRGKRTTNNISSPIISETIEMCTVLETEQIDTLLQSAKLVAEALKPIPGRRGGEGFLQVKVFRRYKKDKAGNPILDERGLPKYTEYGPYLYLRRWLTGGDRDNKKQQLSSLYIGGQVSEGERLEYPYKHLAKRLQESYAKQGKRQVRTALTEKVESKIMDCIDLTTEPPTINHEALAVLENEASIDKL
jgi:hypothetical protein